MELDRKGNLYKYLTQWDDPAPRSICALPWAFLKVTVWSIFFYAVLGAMFVLFVVTPPAMLVNYWFFDSSMPGVIDVGQAVWAIYLIGLVVGFWNIQSKKLKEWNIKREREAWYEVNHKPSVIMKVISDIHSKTCTKIDWK